MSAPIFESSSPQLQPQNTQFSMTIFPHTDFFSKGAKNGGSPPYPLRTLAEAAAGGGRGGAGEEILERTKFRGSVELQKVDLLVIYEPFP